MEEVITVGLLGNIIFLFCLGTSLSFIWGKMKDSFANKRYLMLIVWIAVLIVDFAAFAMLREMIKS